MQRVGLISVLCAACLCGLFAPPAGAVLVHKPNGRSVGAFVFRGVKDGAVPGHYTRHPRPAGFLLSSGGNLLYGGGAVLHAAAPYLIFWDPGNQIDATEKSLLTQYFTDAAHDSGASSNIYGVLRQYTDTKGFADYRQSFSAANQVFTDTDAFPSTAPSACPNGSGWTEDACVTDGQIQAEVQSFVTANSLPSGTSGNAPIYFVVTPPDVNTCIDSSTCADTYYCAYHSAFTDGNTGNQLLYANIPLIGAANDPKSCQGDNFSQVQDPNFSSADPSGSAVADVMISDMSHEFSETITDPGADGSGWTDNIGNEAGDKCYASSASRSAFSPTLGGSGLAGTLYDQLLNGDEYYTQSEYSNADSGCKMKPTAETPHPTFTAPSVAKTGSAVTFNPLASTSSGSYSSVSWSWGDGTTSFTRSAPTSVTHTFTQAGTFTVKLTVVDRYGNVASYSAPITVAPILASFTMTPAHPQTGTTVTLNAGASLDSYGAITSYQWSFNGGLNWTPSSTSRTYTTSFASPGAHSVELQISDATAHSATSTQNLNVDAKPAASFSVTSLGPTAGQPVSFDGTGSNETGGSIVGYSWSFGDGTTPGTGATPTHTFRSAGTFTVKLTVTDQDGYTASITQAVTVARALSASFTMNPLSPIHGRPVSFSAAASSGAITGYSWNFGDGSTATGVTASHTYATAGTVTVTVTVTDAYGHQSQASRTVRVS